MKNVKIASELVKLAKSLVSEDKEAVRRVKEDMMNVASAFHKIKYDNSELAKRAKEIEKSMIAIVGELLEFHYSVREGKVAGTKYIDKGGKEFTSSELKFIKKVAGVMGRPWQAIASRTHYTAIIMEAFERGSSAEDAADAIKKLNTGKG
jgi:hypothetical protein